MEERAFRAKRPVSRECPKGLQVAHCSWGLQPGELRMVGDEGG